VERVYSILAIIIALFFTLAVHELGHFIAGMFYKVRVKEFALGVGPKIGY
jgi:membrane-associated protease RseP (regulator of RpoE activity)